MSRIAARIRHDEVVRMVKAVRSCGLPVASVTFDGQTVRVNIGESGETVEQDVDREKERGGLIREPQV